MIQEAPAFPEPGLWSSVWKLLSMRLVIMISGFRRSKARVKVRQIILLILAVAFVGFILFLGVTLLDFLRSPELATYVGDVTPFIESIPSAMISAAAVGIVVTGFGVLLQVLYLSGDMDFLMSTPIPIRAVFIAKLVQAVLPNFGLMCLFALPILFGLGISNGYTILYYPAVLLMLVLISLAAASLASLLVMAAARVFPARRLAEVLGFVVGTSLFIFSQSSRFLRFDPSSQQVSNLLALTARFNQPWSPIAWAGQGLVALGKGNWLPAAGLLAAAILVTVGIFYAALTTSERLYYTGWSSLQNNRKRQRSRVTAPPVPQARGENLPAASGVLERTSSGLNTLDRFIPATVRAILIKDLLVYRRDLRNVTRLLTPLILGVVYAISLLQTGGQRIENNGDTPSLVVNGLNAFLVYADVALALFLGWMLVANLAGMGFTQEGRNYWILKAAPISSRTLLMAKFLVGYLPPLVVCGVYEVVLQIVKGGSLWSTLISLIAVALALAGLDGIYLAFGTSGAKLDWENPSQVNRGVGCVGSIVGMVYMGVIFGLFIGPPLAATLLDLPTLAGQLVGLLLGGIASIAAVIIPLGMVEKRVATLGENA